jgi:hypothetical protein
MDVPDTPVPDGLFHWRLAPAGVATVGTYLSGVEATQVVTFTQSVATGLTVYLLLWGAGLLWDRAGLEWLDLSRWVPAVATTLATALASVVAVELGVESSTPMGHIVVFGLVIYGSILLVALALGELAVRRVRSILPWTAE